ncbi:hypothetical protein I3F58_01295 [Streptomyces sp. MUM 203J]|uniref:hypothetical protein n=1 Tax=Streptomyces sp. MUM 203J TaxID=2791990 RepID=UPI001F04043E|nr:hypothetical protein [Streptomyces sp. MUM 203J]MCH0538215.1 hypothetical protein [Streptomyces sp. MUM 203J]
MGLRTKTAATATAMLAAALLPVPHPAAAAPDDPRPRPAPEAAPPAALPGLLDRLRTLHRDAEAAEAAYRESDARRKTLTTRTAALTAGLTGTRADLARARAAVGRFARAQYQGGGPGLPVALRLLFARDAQAVLEQGRVLRRAAERQAGELARLEAAEKHAGALAAASRAALHREQLLLAGRRDARDAARLRLLEAARALAELPPSQLSPPEPDAGAGTAARPHKPPPPRPEEAPPPREAPPGGPDAPPRSR